MSRKDESSSCAACKLSRLKCSPDCPLAAYFPATGTQDFQDVIQMYHPPQLKETLRLLKNRDDRDAAVEKIILEARRHRQSRLAAGIVADLQAGKAASIQEHDAVQAQLQDINRRHVQNYVPGPGPLPVSGSGLDENRTCAACKHLRLKCYPDCPLAVYFPSGGTLNFEAVIRTYNPFQLKELQRLFKKKRRQIRRHIILGVRCRCAARIKKHDAEVQAQLRDIKRRHVSDYAPGSGSGRKSQETEPDRRELVLGEPIRDATGPGQETETRSGFGSSSSESRWLNRPGSSKDATTTTEFGSGSGQQMDPGRRVFGLGQRIGDATGSVQEIETRSGSGSTNEEVNTEFGSGSSRADREFGLGKLSVAELYRIVFPILKFWMDQEMEARSGSGSRNEEETTGWTPEDGDMTWIEDTMKYFFEEE